MPLDLDRIKALCFDVDGTLNDTDNQFADIVKSLLKPLDVLPFVDRSRIARRFIMWAEAPSKALLGYADRIGIDNKLDLPSFTRGTLMEYSQAGGYFDFEDPFKAA